MKQFYESLMGNIRRQSYGNQSPSTTPIDSSVDQNTQTSSPVSSWKYGGGGGIELSYSHQMVPDQKQIYNKLKNGRNVYTIANPGAGKTLPVLTHWAEDKLNLNVLLNPNSPVPHGVMRRLLLQPETLPQLVWLVPIRALADNIELDFKNHFASIILQLLNRMIQSDEGSTKLVDVNETREFINGMGRHSGEGQRIGILLNDLLTEITNLKNNLQHVSQDQRSYNISQIQRLDKQFYEYLFELIKQYIDNALVGKAYENVDPGMARSSTGQSFIKPVIVSIYESIPKFINNLNNPLIVADEAQRIQQLDVNQNDPYTRSSQIMTNFNKLLDSNNTKNSQLVLLSGSSSTESAQNLIDYITHRFHRTFEGIGTSNSPFKMPGKNPANIVVKELNGLENFNTQTSIIKSVMSNHNESGVILVVFGKDRIDSLVKSCIPGKGTTYSQVGQKSTMGGNRSHFEKRDVKFATGALTENDIFNPLLRDAVSYGVGFIYRPRETDENKDLLQRDNLIAQTLFTQGRIRMLIATDAVREGLNIHAKTMYLSSILLPPNNQPMDTRSLVQLVNRVGRVPGRATIFTPAKYVDAVRNAINASDDDLGVDPVQTSALKYGGGIIKQKIKTWWNQ